jgi:hypothetical protein
LTVFARGVHHNLQVAKKYLICAAALGLLVLGCGAEGDLGMMGAADAGAMIDALPGTGGSAGGTVATDGGALGGSGGVKPAGGSGGAVGAAKGGAAGSSSGAGGMSGTGGTVASSGGATGTGGAPAEPEILYCPQDTHPLTGGCGFLVQAGTWEYLWKGDMACGTCTDSKSKPVVGCKAPGPAQMTSNPVPNPEYILCVPNCRAECCFKRPGTICESDANCCAPMHCMDNGAGKLKTCR